MDTLNPIDVAKGISDYGFMAVYCGICLALTAWAVIRSVKKITKAVELLSETQQPMYEIVKEIRFGANRDLYAQANVVASYSFDYSRVEVLRALYRIVRDNNLEDRAGVERKVYLVLGNLQATRSIRMSNFSVNGRRLSEYIKPEWVEIVAKAMLAELYSDGKFNLDRAETNIGLVYNEIESSFLNEIRG